MRFPLAACAAALLAVSVVSPATAHTGVIDSDPRQGESLRRPPAQVSITFSEPPLPAGAAMVATGADGRRLLEPRIAGSRLVADWPRQAPAGRYQVNFRVVAADGHPITGEIKFTIAKSPGATPADPTTPVDEVTADSTESTPVESAFMRILPWFLIADLIVVAIILVAIRMRRGSPPFGKRGGR